MAASVEQVGDSSYRLIIKSENEGSENALTITQTGIDFGYGDANSTEFESDAAYNSFTITNGSRIEINGVEVIADTGDDMTLSQLITQIDAHADFSAARDGNSVKITAANGSTVTVNDTNLNLQFSNTNHTVTAQNLKATVDGVDYNVSSSDLTIGGGLKITALKVSAPDEFSTVTVSKDTSAVTLAVEALTTQYNALYDLINDEINDPESVIGNKDTLRTILSDVKNMLFQSYGADEIQWIETDAEGNGNPPEHSNVANNDKNAFMFGLELDKTGHLSVDTTVLNNIINGKDDNYDFDDLQSLFTGVYENKGLGVQIKEYLDDLDSYDGLLTTYETNMDTRKEDLEEDKEAELERLDAKYQIMAEQFSAYSAIIAQMEASFSGLKMMIEQSVASN
jgi:flagellar hook-associated protein 2